MVGYRGAEFVSAFFVLCIACVALDAFVFSSTSAKESCISSRRGGFRG